MPFVTRKSAVALAALGIVGAAIVAGTVWSGVYDIGADSPHTRPVFALLQAVRERSIEVRAAKLAPPDLADPARIRHGAGNYAHMCASCHRAPGSGDTELGRGLYPAPPDLAHEAVDAREAFWTIKHGVKASGMPAWGRSIDDESIWNLAAFVQVLPTLDARSYAALVAASGGHSHGAGERGGMDLDHAHDGAGDHDHAHAGDSDHDHDHDHEDAEPPADADADAQTPHVHVHADGSVHEHPADAAPAAEAEHHDHDHP
jgi:mono/diheme cytochrome c family protein